MVTEVLLKFILEMVSTGLTGSVKKWQEAARERIKSVETHKSAV
jgi:hypothetical protein